MDEYYDEIDERTEDEIEADLAEAEAIINAEFDALRALRAWQNAQTFHPAREEDL